MKALTGRKQKYIWDFKAARGCVDCGERDPWVLDLDHVDPATKDMKPFRSQLPYRKNRRWTSLSWPRLMEELEKCQVLCANCHRRKTAREQGWGRY
jgi:hypothetical protein